MSTHPNSLSPDARCTRIERAISRVGWLTQPGFRWDFSEGYRDGVFGARAGPEVAFEHLAHEIAHAIELVLCGETRRLGLFGYNLRVKSYLVVAGVRYHEPRTTQPSERECRASGIQMHILEAAGMSTRGFPEKMADTLVRFMPDWHLGGADDSQRRRHRLALIEQAYARWTTDEIVQAWAVACRFIARTERRKEAAARKAALRPAA